MNTPAFCADHPAPRLRSLLLSAALLLTGSASSTSAQPASRQFFSGGYIAKNAQTREYEALSPYWNTLRTKVSDSTLSATAKANAYALIDRQVGMALPGAGGSFDGTGCTLSVMCERVWDYLVPSGYLENSAYAVTLSMDVTDVPEVCTLTLTFSGGGEGTAKVNGTGYTASASLQFPPGKEVTVIAEPYLQNLFNGFDGDPAGIRAARTISFILNKSRTLDVSFVPQVDLPNRAPVITWVTPPGVVGTGVSYSLRAEASDDGNLRRITISRSGSEVGSYDERSIGPSSATASVSSTDTGPATITWVATATDAAGASASATHVVTINAPPSVAATLSISPQSTNAPGSATVTWSSEHATAVALSGPNGFQSALPQGSQTVTNLAAGTHSFTLTAQGYGGPITKSVTVTVVEPAQLTAWLTVDPTTATEPAAARLTWGSTNATSVLVTGPASQLSTATSGDHALTALAAGTHTFNLRAEGPGGPLTRSATIVVQPRPASVTATLAASPVFLAAPGNTTLTWSSANASAVAVTGPNFAGSTSPNGTQAITALPVGDHTFTLVAQGQDGPVTRSTLVHVAPAPSGPPVSASIEANPSTGTPPGTTTVTWTSLNATSVIVTGAGLADTTEPNGSRVVKDLPEGLHHFTITAQGVGGPVSRTADFYVSKPLPYVTAALAAEVSVATAPGVAALTWSTENATSVVVSGPGLDPRGEPTGTQTLNGLAAGSHTYTLTAQGFGGPVTRTATVVIGEGSTTGPVTATISTNPDAGGAPGTTTVTWASANATRVSVTGPGLPEKNSPSGSHTVSGLDYGSHVYTITAQGEGGPAVARANFSVISGLSRTLTVVPENTPVPWGGDTVTFTGYSSRAGPGFLNLWRRVFERRLVPTWTIVDSTEDQEAIWGWKDVMTTVELPRVFVTTFTFTMGVGPGQRWGTWNAPDNFSSEPVEYMVETWGQDIYGGHGVALFKQDPAPPPQAQNVVLTPTFATAAPGATVILTAAGGHTSYHWTGLNADTSNQVRFVVPANAVGGSTYPVSVYSPAGRLWSTYWAQSNTVTATIQVVVPRQVTSLTPLASSITVSDPSSPLHGRTYPRMWQDGNWTAYLGRPGVKFAVKANASPSVAAIELQAKPPGGEWTRLALQSPATAAATVDLTFDVMLGETAPGQPLVPLSFQQGAPLTGPWAFRARVQDAAQVWSDPCPEISVNVILPVVTKTLSGQTVPPAGELGQWFTASPLKEFTIPLWIP